MSSKASEASKEDPQSSSQKEKLKEEDDEELERQAIEALLFEAKRGKVRAEEAGPMGWQKCQLNRTNKRFINTVVANAVTSNKRLKLEEQSDKQQRTDSSSSSSKLSQSSKKSSSHKERDRKRTRKH